MRPSRRNRQHRVRRRWLWIWGRRFEIGERSWWCLYAHWRPRCGIRRGFGRLGCPVSRRLGPGWVGRGLWGPCCYEGYVVVLEVYKCSEVSERFRFIVIA